MTVNVAASAFVEALPKVSLTRLALDPVSFEVRDQAIGEGSRVASRRVEVRGDRQGRREDGQERIQRGRRAGVTACVEVRAEPVQREPTETRIARRASQSCVARARLPRFRTLSSPVWLTM